MKIIDRYILNEIKIPVIFGISLFTFIFLIIRFYVSRLLLFNNVIQYYLI